MLGAGYQKTFTLYKLHGSTTWYKSISESTYDPIYWMSHEPFYNAKYQKFVADKRRFIIPPVYDKSSLLNHESIRSLWWQARNYALRQADNIYVIGYSLPGTDAAMQALLWEGSQPETSEKKALYVVDVATETCQRYRKQLGNYYEVKDCYAGYSNAFDMFVDDYLGDARVAS